MNVRTFVDSCSTFKFHEEETSIALSGILHVQCESEVNDKPKRDDHGTCV